MPHDPHEQLEAVFADALARTGGERDAFLDRACAGEPGLRARIGRLLQAHQAAGGFLATPLVAAVAEVAPGSRIGRYKLLENIGEGGIGIVYLAEQEEPFHRKVALKVIKPGMDTREVVARFESERQALALMDHPCIAQVFDAGATPSGRPFFVMELVRGPSITKFCDDEALPLAARLELFIQVCHAIHHAHSAGIIHRDIKPSNILVVRQDGQPLPKVIDFGIAKATEFKLTEKTVVTAVAHFIGTPSYMSPEQAEMSGREIDARSDLYSLGVLLYELLTGRTPFDARELAQSGLDEMRRRIREDEPPRPSTRIGTLDAATRTEIARLRQIEASTLIRELRDELDWVVLRCLEKDCNRRYPAAAALAEDVRRYLRHERVSAVAPSVMYAVGKRLRHHRTTVFLGAAAAITTVAVLSSWFRPPPAVPAVMDPVASPKTIAVLAFEDQSAEVTDGRFADRISEELINMLERIPGLRTQARTSAFLFKGKGKSIPQIARELGVAYVVEGSVTQLGRKVQITPRLLSADGFVQWFEKFSFEPNEVLNGQHEIAGKIARELKLAPVRATRDARVAHPEARRLVLEGRHFWSQRNAIGFQRADEAFTRAIQLEPLNAEAHAGLASMCVIREQYRVLDEGPPTEDPERARREARLAIELDPTLAEPHLALGYGYFIDGKLAAAQHHFEQAAALNPNSAHTQMWYALFQSTQGKLDAALARLEQASESDPLWFPNLQIYNWELAFARRFERALEINERAKALRADVFVPLWGERARILLARGRTDEAVEAAQYIRQNSGVTPRWHADGVAIWVLRRAGREQAAAGYAAERFAQWAPADYRRGFVLAALGQFDEALPYLERTPVVLFRALYWEEMWEPWRGDPRFQQLFVKLGCAAEYAVARATFERLAGEQASAAVANR
jgi:serine/threonine protein kinase/TolB-like protein/tetratricopeptide (TPR) repeat protein